VRLRASARTRGKLAAAFAASRPTRGAAERRSSGSARIAYASSSHTFASNVSAAADKLCGRGPSGFGTAGTWAAVIGWTATGLSTSTMRSLTTGVEQADSPAAAINETSKIVAENCGIRSTKPGRDK